MSRPTEGRRGAEKAARIIQDSGGRLVGRTRLQKIAYILEIVGIGDGFSFEYRHYGPYSEELATAVGYANLLKLIDEEERPATWGGHYSVFTTDVSSGDKELAVRRNLIAIARDADPVELELAATAAFFSLSGETDPWTETAKRKPKKAEEGRLEKAKALYKQLSSIPVPSALPEIV